jgi:hypothetical protein
MGWKFLIDLSAIFSKESIILISVILISIAAIILIISIYLLKKRSKKQEKASSQQIPQNIIKLNNIKDLEPNQGLKEINKIAKKYFKNHLKTEKEMSYRQISKILKNRKEFYLVKLCKYIEYYLYSGNKIKKKDFIKLVNIFERLISKQENTQFDNSAEFKETDEKKSKKQEHEKEIKKQYQREIPEKEIKKEILRSDWNKKDNSAILKTFKDYPPKTEIRKESLNIGKIDEMERIQEKIKKIRQEVEQEKNKN